MPATLHVRPISCLKTGPEASSGSLTRFDRCPCLLPSMLSVHGQPTYFQILSFCYFALLCVYRSFFLRLHLKGLWILQICVNWMRSPQNQDTVFLIRCWFSRPWSALRVLGVSVGILDPCSLAKSTALCYCNMWFQSELVGYCLCLWFTDKPVRHEAAVFTLCIEPIALYNVLRLLLRMALSCPLEALFIQKNRSNTQAPPCYWCSEWSLFLSFF